MAAAISARDILEEIEPQGSASYRKVLRNHGVPEPMFGVKISYLKQIEKRIKRDYDLSLELYDTGIYDAMYLAGLIADDPKMTKKNLQHWLDRATCGALRQSTVAWVAAGNQHGYELALKWIDSKSGEAASAGWSTLSSLVAVRADSDLDLSELKRLLGRVQQSIHQQADAVRYTMNSFVIAVGSYVLPLNSDALRAARQIGAVTVNMGNTDCKVPDAAACIDKVKQRGSLGKKRKSAKC